VTGRDRGTVTVEVAIALPALTLLLATLLATGSIVVSQVRLAEAARAGAREAALGVTDEAIASVVGRVAGSSTNTTVSRSAGLVTVEVAIRVQVPGLGRTHTLSASASAQCEPDRGCG
jgi:Flp pilus assembly protein TadG